MALWRHRPVRIVRRVHLGTLRVLAGVVGALIYAGGGAYLGGMNAGWFGAGQSNAVLPVLGLGAALVVVGFARSRFSRSLREVGTLGQTAQVFLVLGPALYVLSWLIDFAIFGTLTMALGLFCLSVAVVAKRLGGVLDRVLIPLSAVGSITWNTETTSAFLLVGVGLAWAVLSVRLLRRDVAHRSPVTAGS